MQASSPRLLQHFRSSGVDPINFYQLESPREHRPVGSENVCHQPVGGRKARLGRGSSYILGPSPLSCHQTYVVFTDTRFHVAHKSGDCSESHLHLHSRILLTGRPQSQRQRDRCGEHCRKTSKPDTETRSSPQVAGSIRSAGFEPWTLAKISAQNQGIGVGKWTKQFGQGLLLGETW